MKSGVGSNWEEEKCQRKGKNSVEKVSYRVVRIGWRKRNGLSRREAEIKKWGKET